MIKSSHSRLRDLVTEKQVHRGAPPLITICPGDDNELSEFPDVVFIVFGDFPELASCSLEFRKQRK